MMWKSCETQPNLINLGLDPRPNGWGKLEEVRIKGGIVDLQRGAQVALYFSLTRRSPRGHFTLGFFNNGFELRGELQFVLQQIVKPVADLN